ncbi:MAG TPA: hypothetical protein VGR21_07285, partial [Cryptosporangiaceae bacterium]|nr:hypothetical protein [Cryptosporangiaceae bacterium]
IVGVGLRMVEEVLGRLTYLRAALMGAGTGAWIGFLIGLFLALFVDSVGSLLTVVGLALLWGAVAGALFGLVSHALSGGRRDFVSVSQLVADRYEVLVDAAHVDRARELIEARQT